MPEGKSIVSRKHFLKVAGIMSLMANSVVSFFSKAFGQNCITSRITTRLNLTAIFPDPHHVGRPGIHLRWMFALQKGFPDSFQIFRTPVSANEDYTIIEEAKIKGNDFYSVTENGEALQLQFKESIEYLYLYFKDFSIFSVRAYADSEKRFERFVNKENKSGIAEFQGVINKVDFPKDKFASLKLIRFIRKGDGCKAKWDQIAEIRTGEQVKDFEIRKGIYFEGYHNFYLPPETGLLLNIAGREIALQKYLANTKKYRLLLSALKWQNSPQLTITDSTPKDKRTEICYNWNRLEAMLCMSIVDPNIARILGLYFVDDKANADKKYDYKIIASYPPSLGNDCACVYNVGKDYDPLPGLGFTSENEKENFKAEQLNRSDFIFNDLIKDYEQHDATELVWPAPATNLNTNPVNFFLVKNPDKLLRYSRRERRIKNKWVYNRMEGQVIQPSKQNNIPNYQYTDYNVAVEKNEYRQNYSLAGIDLYGRVSEFAETSLKIKDKSIPAAPVNLRITQNNQGTKYFLRFEYGPAQYLKSPDALKFILYKKKYSLNTKQRIKFSATFNGIASNSGGEYINRLFTIHIEDNFTIRNPDGTALNNETTNLSNFRFKTFHVSEDLTGNNLPASERRTFQIVRIINDKTFQIVSEKENLISISAGYGYLNINTGNPKLWTHTELTLPFDEPVAMKLTAGTTLVNVVPDSRTYFLAKVINVTKIEIPSNDDGKAVVTYKKVTELFLNRALYESGLFNNGTLVRSNGLKHTIIAQASVYSTLGSAQNTGGVVSKILIDGYVNILRNEIIGLAPAKKIGRLNPVSSGNRNDIRGLIKLYFTDLPHPLLKEGSILLPAKINAGTNPIALSTDIPVAARLMSDISKPAPHLPYEALLYILNPVNRILINNTRVYFFASYQMNITDEIQIDVMPGNGTASNYFALTTVDESDQKNESSLSLPVQNISYLTEPPPKPGAITVCSSVNNGTPQPPYYLTLPNKEGRSTICLQWVAVGSANRPFIRYELTRALDVSILAALRSKWMINDTLLGTTESNPVPVMLYDLFTAEGIAIAEKDQLTIQNLHVNVTGVYEAVLVNPGLFSENDKKVFLGARSKIESRWFLVAGFAGNTILLRLLTPVKNGNANKSGQFAIKLQTLPDLLRTSLVTNTEKLKELADICPEAFSMVTKVPVRNPGNLSTLQYTDNVPGQGNGKYFYKVRSVDAAENRSAWSDCSEAFYQVDIQTPESPQDFSVDTGDRCARLIWRKIEPKNSFDRYEIFRFLNNQEQNYTTPYAIITKDQVSDPQEQVVKKVRAMLGSITIPVEVKTSVQPGPPETLAARITDAKNSLAITIKTTDDGPNLYTSLADFEIIHQKTDNDTAILIKTIRDLKGRIPDGIPLKIIFNGTLMEIDRNWFEFFDTGLEGGNNYVYTMRLKTKPKYLSEMIIKEETIRSQMTAQIKITGIDKSEPIVPQVLNFSWVDVNDHPVTIATPNSQLKLHVNSASITKFVLFQIKYNEQDIWKDAIVNGKQGWSEWAGATHENSFRLFFNHENTNAFIQAKIQTQDGRISTFSPTINIQ